MNKRHGLAALAPLLLLALAACVSDNNPVTPTLDAQFVGYSNADTKQTTCGNCHIDRQRTWQTTKHAQAWADLQASGHASSFCYKCHTTNGQTNLAADTAGYFSVADNAKKFYQDVQCESCHGPGAGHVAGPDAFQPLSTVHADTAQAWGCGTCHTGTHNPFVDQWKHSLHSNVEAHAASSTDPTCRGCHSAQGAIGRFDPKADYIEKTATQWEPIACAVCHDPHGGTGNAHQLRFPVNTADLSTNLCMQCHYRRSVPDPTSSRGGHSPQGPMLLGEAGWVPPNFQYNATQQASTHGTSANPNLCATCHMEAYDVTDKVSGTFVFHSAGHLFRAIPCVDANGQPIDTLRVCPDTQRRFNACAAGGCHATGAQALADRQVLTGRLQADIRTIWIDANGNGVLDPFPTDSGLVARVRATSPCDFSTSATPPSSGPCLGQPAGNTVITVGEGAWFNADLVQRADGSYGVHNPIYAEALLLGTITALHAQYTYLPSPPPAEQAAMIARMQALGMKP